MKNVRISRPNSILAKANAAYLSRKCASEQSSEADEISHNITVEEVVSLAVKLNLE